MEARLLSQVDGSAALLDLYDLDMSSAASEVARRIEDPTYASRTSPQVQAVSVLRDESGQTYAYVDAIRAEDGATTQIIWRLANGSLEADELARSRGCYALFERGNWFLTLQTDPISVGAGLAPPGGAYRNTPLHLSPLPSACVGEGVRGWGPEVHNRL